MVGRVQVRSAVIPAAGLGTRFLPATKAVPKELMPIGDTPAIQIIIDEALGAGVEHIVVVSSRSKPAIESYFAPDDALVEAVRAKGNDRLADRLASIGRDWRVTITYQDNPRGLGHAVGCARQAVGDEPFAVLLPDELMGDSSLLAQMNGVCASTGGSVVGVKQVPHDQVSSYGVVAPAGPISDDGVIPVADLIEKPPVHEAPSDYILIGRYVLTPDVFDEIERLTPGSGGELQLTDALRAQAARGSVLGRAVAHQPLRHRKPGRIPGCGDRLRPRATPRCRPASSKCSTNAPPAESARRSGNPAVSAVEIGDDTEFVDVELDRRGARRRSPAMPAGSLVDVTDRYDAQRHDVDLQHGQLDRLADRQRHAADRQRVRERRAAHRNVERAIELGAVGTVDLAPPAVTIGAQPQVGFRQVAEQDELANLPHRRETDDVLDVLVVDRSRGGPGFVVPHQRQAVTVASVPRGPARSVTVGRERSQQR